MIDHQGRSYAFMGRLPTWDMNIRPETREEALKYLRLVHHAYIMDTEHFNQFIRGEWHLPPTKPIRPFFMWKMFEVIRMGHLSWSNYPSHIFGDYIWNILILNYH